MFSKNEISKQYQLSENKKNIDNVAREYISLLINYFNLEVIKKENCAEVVENNEDSLLLPYKTTVITPDITSANRKNGATIRGKIAVINGKLHLYDTASISSREERTFCKINTLITHNPYNNGSIMNWNDFCTGILNGDILVGIYGFLSDSDVSLKNNIVDKLKNNMVKKSTDVYGLLDDDSYVRFLTTLQSHQIEQLDFNYKEITQNGKTICIKKH